jgi:ubiquitin-conjugating enzyme E2 J1
VRTALVAIRSFMDTDVKGQLGGIECSKDARERIARDSGKWTCAGCAKSNAEIMKEREKAVKEIEEKEGKRKEEEVPEELRLAYREDLNKNEESEAERVDKGKGKAIEPEAHQEVSSRPAVPTAPASPVAVPIAPVVPAPRPTRTVPAPPLQQLAQQSADRSLAWIDTCIWGVIAMLLFMVIKKFDML